MIKVQLLQVVLSFLVSRIYSRVREEFQTNKNQRTLPRSLAIIVPCLVSNNVVVETDFSGFRQVEPGEEFSKGSFATPIAPCKEYQFASIEAQIDGPQNEVVVFRLAVIRMGDAGQL